MVDRQIVSVAAENGLADTEFKYGDSLYNNVWLSIQTPRGSRFNDQTFGSRMHELKKTGKVNAETLSKAEMWAEQSVAWMKTVGKVSSVSVSATINAVLKTRINLQINLVKSDGEPITYTMWYDVI